MGFRRKLIRCIKSIARTLHFSSTKHIQSASTSSAVIVQPVSNPPDPPSHGLLLYPVDILHQITFLLDPDDCMNLILTGDGELQGLLLNGGIRSVYVDCWNVYLADARGELNQVRGEQILHQALPPADFVIRAIGPYLSSFHLALYPTNRISLPAIDVVRYSSNPNLEPFFFPQEILSGFPSSLQSLYISTLPLELATCLVLTKEEQSDSDDPVIHLGLRDLFPLLHSLEIDIRTLDWLYSLKDRVFWQFNPHLKYSLSLPRSLTRLSIPLMCIHPSFSASIGKLFQLETLILYASPVMECWEIAPKHFQRFDVTSNSSGEEEVSSTTSCSCVLEHSSSSSNSQTSFYSAHSNYSIDTDSNCSWPSILSPLHLLKHFGFGTLDHLSEFNPITALHTVHRLTRFSIDTRRFSSEWTNILPDTLEVIDGSIRAIDSSDAEWASGMCGGDINKLPPPIKWPSSLKEIRFEINFFPTTIESVLGFNWIEALPAKLQIFSLTPFFPNTKSFRSNILYEDLIRILPAFIQIFELPSKIIWSLGASHLPDGSLPQVIAHSIGNLRHLTCDELYGQALSILVNLEYLSVGNAVGWYPQYLRPLRRLRVLIVLSLQNPVTNHRKRMFKDVLARELPDTLEVLTVPDITGYCVPKYLRCLYVFKAKKLDIESLFCCEPLPKLELLDVRRRKRSFPSSLFSVLPPSLKVLRLRNLDVQDMEDFNHLPNGLLELYFDIWKRCKLNFCFGAGSDDTHPIRFYRLKQTSPLINLQSYYGEYWYIIPTEVYGRDSFPKTLRGDMWTQHWGTFMDREIDLIMRQSMRVPWYTS